MERLKFETTEFEFVENIKLKSTYNLAYWRFEGDPSYIDSMKASCGCTIPKVKDGAIVAYYSANETAGDFSGSIVINYKDGRENTIIDGSSGDKVPNPAKARDILTLKGTKK